jgi:Ca-activated chloride channel family protein
MLYNWFKEIDFAQPLVFFQFAWIPVLVWWYRKKSSRQLAAIRVSSSANFQVSTFRNQLRHVPFILRLLAISSLILALARPQKRNDLTQTQGEGIDIILCMDVSGSMGGSRDIEPTRLEAAKEVAEQFIRSRPVDRIGLVIFSGEAFSQVPLTTDKDMLISQVRSLESRGYLADGTVIGEGLATAVDRLSQSTARSKVIILLTDGKEDPPETRLIDPLTALEIAKSKGIKVYTIGVGAMPSSVVERTGSTKPALKTGAIDFIDEELLRRIAEETGGRYFRAKDKETLKSVYELIDKFEKTKVDITSYKKFEERFIPFILAALGLLFLELLLRFTVLRRYP